MVIKKKSNSEIDYQQVRTEMYKWKKASIRYSKSMQKTLEKLRKIYEKQPEEIKYKSRKQFWLNCFGKFY